MTCWIGIDVAKHTLEWASSADDAAGQVPNTPAGWDTLIDQLRPMAPAGVVMEATGTLAVGIHLHLTAAGIASTVLNPAWSHAFARSTGQLKKTDRADARMLARYGQEKQPAATPVTSPHQRQLTALIRRRGQLVKQQVMEKNRRQGAGPDDPVVSLERSLAFLAGEIAEVSARIDALVAEDVSLRLRVGQLRSMPGIGPVVSTWLVTRLPELGEVDRRAIAALAGVAPHPQESGRRHARRTIRGGRGEVRRALYMAAQTAVHHDPYFQTYFRRYMARPGKEYKMGIVAVMNKMLTLLTVMVRDGLVWEQTHACHSVAPQP